MKTFAQIITEQRQQKHFSQSQLANHLAIHQARYKRDLTAQSSLAIISVARSFLHRARAAANSGR